RRRHAPSWGGVRRSGWRRASPRWLRGSTSSGRRFSGSRSSTITKRDRFHYVCPGAKMTKQRPWFFKERAEAFASLMLTTGNNATNRPQVNGPDRGTDLLVEILKDGKPTLRFFGVRLVAVMDLPEMKSADERALLHSEWDPHEAGLPICVFVIGVRKPEGVFRW